MNISTKYYQYNINNLTNEKCVDEFSCSNDCRHCMKCEIGFINAEMVGGF